MSDFNEKVVNTLDTILIKLEKIENKLIEHDSRFSKIETKLETITEQTAHNSELEHVVNQNADSIEKLEFEVELIKKYLRT